MTNAHTNNHMKTTTLLKKMFLTALLAILPTAAFATSSEQRAITLSTTPVAVGSSSTTGCGGSHVVISTTPGSTGKVYIGTSTLNRSTLAGVAVILYPNSGAHSERFEYTPVLDICNLYIAGDVAGETALFSDVLGSTTSLYDWLVSAGPIGQSGSGGANRLLSSSNQNYSAVRVQTIPGQSGKIEFGRDAFIGHETDGTLTGVQKVLWPNSGTLSQHNGWSEHAWVTSAETINSGWYDLVDPYQFVVYPEVAGEQALVALFRTNGFNVTPASYNEDHESGALFTSTTPMQFSTTLGAVDQLTFSVVPAYCGKVYIGNSSMNTSTLAGVYKVLYPTSCNGGWSEEVELTAASIGFNYLDTSAIYIAGQNAGDAVTWSSRQLTGSFATTSTKTIAPQAVSLTATPTALSFGTTRISDLLLSVAPGGSGKVYIGTSSMNTSTLAGVWAILYPNAVGNMSESVRLTVPVPFGASFNMYDDLVGGNIYVAGGVTGDILLVSSTSSGTSSTGGDWYAKSVGPVSSGSYPSVTYSFNSRVRTQAIPGGSGKLTLSKTSSVAVLWPNTGSYSVGEGWSETFDWFADNGSLLSFSPAVSGEQVLYGLFSR